MTKNEIERFITKSVADYTEHPGFFRDHLVFDCRNSYKRSYFFTSQFAPLKGHELAVDRTIKVSGLIPQQAPSLNLLRQAAKREAMTLDSIMNVAFALKTIRDGEHTWDFDKETARYLQQAFPNPDILAPASIHASIRIVKWEIVERVRSQSAPESDLADFSQQVFGDTSVDRQFARYLLTYLHGGYKAPPPYKGLYKITTPTAEALRQGLARLCPDDPELQELDDVAPVDAYAGPHGGKISCALPAQYGNIVPCFR